MASQHQTKFASGMDWVLRSMTLRPQHGTVVEIQFTRSDGRSLQLTLRGVRTVGSLVEVLHGFDDFEILSREDITPYAEFERFLCRFYRDDDRYETVIDDFETQETEPEPPVPPREAV